MRKVLLPYVEPMYSTYQYLASLGIAAKQNSTSDNWYYNNTVDWQCLREFLHGFTGLEMGLQTERIVNIPFLDISSVSNRFIRYCVLDVIKTMLDDGYYVVFTGVDDFYIKGKSWYNEKHFYHDGLIIGYDNEENTLTIVAYDQRWIFTVFDTPESCFVEGLQTVCEKSLYGNICAVKVKEDIHKLDLVNIYEDLKKYLSSDIYTYPLQECGAAKGIVVYDFICMYLDKLADGSISHERRDRRVFRMIWEHKKCMLGRIKAIEEQYKWDNSLSTAYDEVVTLSDKIRFIYSKFVLKYSNKDLENIQINLMRMKELEQHLLNRFTDLLAKELTMCEM